MKPILTGDQCKRARSALGLSQAAAARATDINRSQLALFEVRRYVLEDERLKTLRRFFESEGVSFDTDGSDETAAALGNAAAESVLPDTQVLDGFVVASGLDDLPAEDVLAEIASNDHEIQRLAALPGRASWWSETVVSEDRDAALRLMARNYQLVRNLQGRDVLPQPAVQDASVPPVASQLLNLLNASELRA